MGKLLVQKFGGTSLASLKRIEAVADIIYKTVSEGNKAAVVVSAMAGETDRLIDLSNQIQLNPNPNLREYDALVSTGEQISVALMAMALTKRGLKAKSYTAYQLGICTNERHGRARILDVKADKLIFNINKGIKIARKLLIDLAVTLTVVKALHQPRLLYAFPLVFFLQPIMVVITAFLGTFGLYRWK